MKGLLGRAEEAGLGARLVEDIEAVCSALRALQVFKDLFCEFLK